MRTIPPALQAKLDSGVTTLVPLLASHAARRRRAGLHRPRRGRGARRVTCRAGTGFAGSEATSELGLAVAGSEISGALVGRRADRGRPRRRPLRRRGDRSSSGRLERAGAPRAARARACSARCGARARPSPPSCAGSRIASTRRAGGSTPRPARPISATRAAPSISTIRRFAAAARSRRSNGTSSFTASGLGAFADGWFTAGRLTWHQRRQ